MMNLKDNHTLDKSFTGKKSYHKPLLTEIGKLKSVTKAKPGANADSGSFTPQNFES